jgi:hypothetical protein
MMPIYDAGGGEFVDWRDSSPPPETYRALSGGEIAALTNPPTAQFATKIAAGLAITFTGKPSISATYALDPLSQDQLWNIALGLGAGLGFPQGASSFAYPDASGTPRTFSAAEFKSLAQAVRDYVFQLRATLALLEAEQVASWPSPAVTIA